MDPRAATAQRYARWVWRWRWTIMVGSLAVVAVAGALAARLPVRAELAELLPPSTRSVRDLRVIERRARALGTVIVVVAGESAQARRAAAVALRARIERIDPALVARVTFDARAQRRYAWANRWLFAPLGELVRARDAVRAALARHRLAQNPLYVDLDPEPAAPGPLAAALRARLRDLERTAAEPGELVSQEGRLQLIAVRAAFAPGALAQSRRLLAALDAAVAAVAAEHAGVRIGVAGELRVAVLEHDAILGGMRRATVVTVLCVLVAMLWFFRSALVVGAVAWALAVGTLAAFGLAWWALGALNLATAFLASIVIGNGINVGIVVSARYLEELRGGRRDPEALARALGGSFAGTLAAALVAAVAYGALGVTSFRGFRHFAVLGSVGMLACWLSGYVVLPALLAVARDLGLRPGRAPPLGRWLARLLPRRPAVAVRVAAVVGLAAAVVVAAFLAGTPFETDFKRLRSRGAALTAERAWMRAIDDGFGRGLGASFVVAVEHRADVAAVAAGLRAARASAGVGVGVGADAPLLDGVRSLDDLLPDCQPEKLTVLAELRRLLADATLASLDGPTRAEARALRPPAGLRALADADVPDALAWPFVERDGTRGRLLFASAAPRYDRWNARDMVRFARELRGLALPAGTSLGGMSFVFADVTTAVASDGPRAAVIALFGAVVIVGAGLGCGRHAAATLACGVLGTVLMIATAALLGLKINFLDFVALPLTLGIGVDYAVNLAARERQDGPGSVAGVIATTGGAVVLCSYTTIVGYGSLLLSDNQGIRSFGLAAMLGELSCLAVALVLAPALLGLTAPPGTSSGTSSGASSSGRPGRGAAPGVRDRVGGRIGGRVGGRVGGRIGGRVGGRIGRRGGGR